MLYLKIYSTRYLPPLFSSDWSINGHCYYYLVPAEDLLLLRACCLQKTQPCDFKEQLRFWVLESNLTTWILASSFKCCGLGKLFNFYVPYLPLYYNGEKNSACPLGLLWRRNDLIHVNPLEQYLAWSHLLSINYNCYYYYYTHFTEDEPKVN